MRFGDIYELKKSLDGQRNLKIYLLGELHPYVEDFDILDSWKINAKKYLVLEEIVLSILAIPIVE